MLNHSHTVLAVDDEPISLRMLERLLRDHYTVLTASSGDQALAILQSESVSLILTDQRMPGMFGTELLRRSQVLYPDMVRILITATADSDTFIDAIKNSGASRVIAKPWDPAKLLQTVQEALTKYESRLEGKKALNRLKQANEDMQRMASDDRE